MEDGKQQTQQRECKHYLWLTLRFGVKGTTLWARCRFCRRGWFIGDHAEIIAGLAQFEGERA
jgi:hypothetical protein